jgi:hypothetical protein
MLSLPFVKVGVTQKGDYRVKWLFVMGGCSMLFVCNAAYFVRLPVFSKVKENYTRIMQALLLSWLVYFVTLSLILVSVQVWFSEQSALTCYTLSGQVGLVFGLLLVYDSMNTDTREYYDLVMQDLDQEIAQNNEMQKLVSNEGRNI